MSFSEPGRARILFLSNVYPLPPDDGTKMRVLTLCETLAKLGDVDMFTLGEPDETAPLLPTRRVRGIARKQAWRPASNLRWFVSSQPHPWPGRDTSEARRQLRDWIEPPYDLVFYNRVETSLTFGAIDARRSAIDLDALQSERLTTRLASGDSPTGLKRIRDRVDGGRWRRLEQRVTADVDLSIVCNSADLAIIDRSDTVLIANGFPDTPPAGHPEIVSSPPLIGLVAAFGYGPNEDAGRTLVTRVMPEIRARAPEARLVLVGKDGERLSDLEAGRPWLTITGWVDDVTEWLSKIDVMVMPVEYGGGTRLKVLESLCHRIPIVATPYTIKGHDLVAGEHLLVGRTPTEMADHTLLLLEDSSLRTSLADTGRARFLEAHTWAASSEKLEARVRELLTT